MAIWIVPSLAYAQDACVVLSSDIKPYREALEGFKGGFRGKVRDMVLGTDPSAAGKIVAEINKPNCEVTVAMGSKALKFLKLRISNKPIVFAMTLSPSAEGTVGRNISGVYLESSPGDTLAAIKEVLPSASSVGIIYSPSSRTYISEASKAASKLGLRLNASPAPSLGDAIRVTPVISTKSDVLWMIPDLITSSQGAFKAMLESSLKNNIPLFALSQKHVKAGALAALVTNYKENGQQAAAIASRVARGTPASSIPHEYARQAGIVINMKSASRLELTIPKSVIDGAVEVYR